MLSYVKVKFTAALYLYCILISYSTADASLTVPSIVPSSLPQSKGASMYSTICMGSASVTFTHAHTHTQEGKAVPSQTWFSHTHTSTHTHTHRGAQAHTQGKRSPADQGSEVASSPLVGGN